MNATRIAATLAAAALLPFAAGCGGGGSSAASAPPAAPPQSGPRIPARAVATIVIPPARPTSSAARGVRWVSPSTKSLQINAKRLSDSWTEITVQALTPTTNGCSAQSNGSTICQVPFNAPPTDAGGNDDITVTLYDLVDPYIANILGFAEIQQPVLSMQSNVFNFVVGGVVDGVSSSPPSSSVSAAQASNVTLAVTFYDRHVNTINGTLDSPVIVSMQGPAASHFTITSPAPAGGSATLAQAGSVTVHYDGTGTKGSFAAVAFSTNSPSTFSNYNGNTPPTQVGFVTISIN